MQIFQLLWPLIIEQLLNVLVGMADVLMVALVGEAAVSGVALVDSVSNLIIQVLFAVTAGGTVVCAQFIGAGDRKMAGRAGAQLLGITLGGGITVCVLFLLGGDALLYALFGKVEPVVRENASRYLFITLFSFPFLAIYHSCASIFRANRNSRLPLRISLIMNGINIAGNAICIIGLKMGVTGVAIPTLIARASAAIMIFLRLQKSGEGFHIESFSQLRPQGNIIRRILSIGIPNGIESGLFQLGKVMLQSLVSTLGTPSIAAYAVASNLDTYLYLPGNALGAGMTTIVGQCVGANEPRQAKEYAKLLVALNYALLAVISTALAAGRGLWVSFYHLTPDSAVLAEGLVLIHSVAMIIWPVAFLLPYYFRAIGRAAFTMGVALFAMWTFRIGLAYVYIRFFHMNVLGVWYAMFVDWIFRFVVYAIAFHRSGIRT